MTYSSFDPSKIDVDAAKSYANATQAFIDEEEQRIEEEARKALQEEQRRLQEQKENEVSMPVKYTPSAAMEPLEKWMEENLNIPLVDLLDPNRDAEEVARDREKFRLAWAKRGAEQKYQQDLMEARKASMDPSQYGITENTMELRSAIAGGAAKTWSSIFTFPERIVDMTSGAMQREIEETGEYRPDFDPMGLSQYDPALKTWWGKLIEMGVHFAGLGKGLQTVAGVKKTNILTDLGIGAASDIISSTAQESNLSQEVYESKIVERVPFMGQFLNQGIGVLATKDTDHPWMKTFKNALEGMGADLIVGSILRKAFGGEALDASRQADIEAQKTEAVRAEQASNLEYETRAQAMLGVQELSIKRIQAQIDKLPEGPKRDFYIEELEKKQRLVNLKKTELDRGEFSAYSNRDIADPHLGAPNSRVLSTEDAVNQAKRMDETWSPPGAGSMDSMFTPVQASRMASENGILESEMQNIAKELLGDANTYQEMLAEVKSQRRTFGQVYGYAFKRFQETIGRDTTALDAKDFWKLFFEDKPARTGGDEDLAYWATKNVVAADLVNASLFSQLRDLGLASRELFDVVDVFDTDGPMKTIADRLIVGLTNVKRSRYLVSNEFRKLQGPKGDLSPEAQIEVDARLESFRADSQAAVNMFFNYAKELDNDAVARALVEAFSMSNKIENWRDLDAYMRNKLRSGGFNQPPGEIVRELQTVMMHSMLSGPKTPLRAIMGTSTASILRPINVVIGAGMRGDWDVAKASMASLNAYRQTIPEAWKLFSTNLHSYWSGDVATVQTRYLERKTRSDDEWEFMGHWADTRGTDGDKIAYNFADMVRKLNNNRFLNYSTSIMGAADDAFTLLMARARSREKAMNLALSENKYGDVAEITPKLISDYENAFYKDLLDADGNINLESDLYLKSIVKEATLTQDLSGFARALDKAFDMFPLSKPFYFFARTGVNGLNLSYKSSPLLGVLHKQSIDILRANEDNLGPVLQYGIRTAEDLANAKALVAGRQAIGFSVVSMAAAHYMNGGITGNGPQDRRQRKLWMDTGWQPRSIKIGNVWVGYDAFEPFNTILAAVADIGDNMELMGPQWAEENLASIGLAVMGTATSKSFLQGVSQFVDLFSGEERQHEKIIANIANNTIPLGALRNELGKLFNPYMREINGSILESIRNRNLITEFGPRQLPAKYDILNGKPIRDWNFMEKIWNVGSPINLRFEESPGRTMLWNSGYDLRLVSYTSPDGIDLSDHPQARSWFQQELGKLNLEAQLNELAKDKGVQASIKKMQDDARNGRRELDPMKAYAHNDLIKIRFEAARKQAWANVRKAHPVEIEALYEARTELRKKTARSRYETKELLSNY